MPRTFNGLPRSFMTSAVAALALLTAAGTASAVTKQEMNAAFGKFGFEYREDERPYGLPIKAKLTRVNIGNETYELDLASPLTRQGVDSAINDYLARHAANELQLISMLVGAPMGNIKVDPNEAFVEELRSVLIKPPLRIMACPARILQGKWRHHRSALRLPLRATGGKVLPAVLRGPGLVQNQQGARMWHAA